MKKNLLKIFIPCKENNYFPLFLRRKFLNYYLILILILKIFTIPLILYISKTIFFADITKNALVEFLNIERRERGLAPLSLNPVLSQSAYLKAKDMLKRGYFSHWSPDGISPWYWFKLAGYDYQFAGENLAIGFLDSKEVNDAWMASPSHRQNILNPNYKEVGIAVLKGNFNGNEVYLVVQHFGTPREKKQIKIKTNQSNLISQTKKIEILATNSNNLATQSRILSEKNENLSSETSSTLNNNLNITTSSLLAEKEKISVSSSISENLNKKENLETTSSNFSHTDTQFLAEKENLEQNFDNLNSQTSSFISSYQNNNLKLQKIAFSILNFAATKYTFLLNLIIYFTLAFLVFSLSLTIYFDIFVYRKFIIDYKGLIPRLITFSVILILFLYIDKTKLLQIIPHQVLIYGF